jgi:hypothetical protein
VFIVTCLLRHDDRITKADEHSISEFTASYFLHLSFVFHRSRCRLFVTDVTMEAFVSATLLHIFEHGIR